MWALKRKFSIIFIFLIIIFIFLYIVYINFYKKEPTCFDKIQNGKEEGVDCGGICKEVCSFKATDVNIFWSRVFYVSDGVSNLASLIENPNFDYILKGLFNITVLNKDGVRLIDLKKEIELQPSEKRLLFIPSLKTGENSLTRVFVKLEKIDSLVKAIPVKNQLEIKSKKFINENENLAKVTVLIKNKDLILKRDIEVAVVLYDKNGNVLNVGKTFLDYLEPREEKEVYLTWPKKFKVLPTQIDVYLRIIKDE